MGLGVVFMCHPPVYQTGVRKRKKKSRRRRRRRRRKYRVMSRRNERGRETEPRSVL